MIDTNEEFLASLDSERSRQIVAALDVYKAENGINKELTPEEIVDAAKNPESVLHRFFDWNHASAAHKHRLNTARKIYASVRYIVSERTEVTYKAFVSVKETPADERRYERISTIMTDESLKLSRLKDFQISLAGLLTQYADIDKKFLNPVKALRDKVTAERNKELV